MLNTWKREWQRKNLVLEQEWGPLSRYPLVICSVEFVLPEFLPLQYLSVSQHCSIYSSNLPSPMPPNSATDWAVWFSLNSFPFPGRCFWLHYASFENCSGRLRARNYIPCNLYFQSSLIQVISGLDMELRAQSLQQFFFGIVAMLHLSSWNKNEAEYPIKHRTSFAVHEQYMLMLQDFQFSSSIKNSAHRPSQAQIFTLQCVLYEMRHTKIVCRMPNTRNFHDNQDHSIITCLAISISVWVLKMPKLVTEPNLGRIYLKLCFLSVKGRCALLCLDWACL